MKRESLSVFFILLIGFLLRLDLLVANNFVIDSDEAIVGLMAKHITEGSPIPTFYYGQHYMGSFEALCVAAGFKVFGVSSAVLKSVPLLFSVLLIGLVYWFARLVGNKRAATIAALCMAIAPAPLLVWSSMARGGFIELVFLGMLGFISLAYWLRTKSAPLLFLSWIILGFGWWVNNQIIYFMLPAAFAVGSALLWQIRPFIKSTLVAAALCITGFFLGSLPSWIYNFTHDFPSRDMFKPVPLHQVVNHLWGVFDSALPMLLGAKRFWSSAELLPFAQSFMYLVYVLLVLGVLMWRWRQIAELGILKLDSDRPIELLLLFIATTVTVFCFSSYGSLVLAPRYLLPLYPAIFIVSGLVIDSLMTRFGKVAAVLFACVIALNLCSSYLGGRAIPGEPFVYDGERVSKDQTELKAWLLSQGYHSVRTNYWIGYRLAFETQEQITFSIFQSPYQVRIPEYEKKAFEESKRSGITLEQLPLVLTPAQAVIVMRAFDAMGTSYRQQALSNYVVLHTIDAPTANSFLDGKLIARATHSDRNAREAIDHDTKTRWGSSAPQAVGMEFSVTLSTPQKISGFQYNIEEWPQDYPRRMAVFIEDGKGERKQLFDQAQVEAIRYWNQESARINFYFPAQVVKSLILQQQGQDPIFDWSIGELTLLK